MKFLVAFLWLASFRGILVSRQGGAFANPSVTPVRELDFSKPVNSLYVPLL